MIQESSPSKEQEDRRKFDFLGSSPYQSHDHRRHSSSREVRGHQPAPHDMSDGAGIYPGTSFNYGATQTLHESGSDDMQNTTEIYDYVPDIHSLDILPEKSDGVHSCHSNSPHKTQIGDLADFMYETGGDQILSQRRSLRPLSNAVELRISAEKPSSQRFNQFSNTDLDFHVAADPKDFNSIDFQANPEELWSGKGACAERESLPSSISAAREQIVVSGVISSQLVLPPRTTVSSREMNKPSIEVGTHERHNELIIEQYYRQHGTDLQSSPGGVVDYAQKGNDTSSIAARSREGNHLVKKTAELSRSQRKHVGNLQQMQESGKQSNNEKRHNTASVAKEDKPRLPDDSDMSLSTKKGNGAHFHPMKLGTSKRDELVKTLSGESDPVQDLLMSSSIPSRSTKSDSLMIIREASIAQGTEKPKDQRLTNDYNSSTSKGLQGPRKSQYLKSSNTLFKQSSSSKVSSSKRVHKDEETMQEKSNRVVLPEKTNLTALNSNHEPMQSKVNNQTLAQPLGSTRASAHVSQTGQFQPSSSSMRDSTLQLADLEDCSAREFITSITDTQRSLYSVRYCLVTSPVDYYNYCLLHRYGWITWVTILPHGKHHLL